MATREELLKIYPQEQIDLNPNLLSPDFKITSDNLASTATPNFQTSQSTVPTSITGITDDIPEVKPAPIEKEADVFSERLRAINESLLGQGAFKRQKETELGQVEAQQSLDDLSVRLRDLERQEKAIPIQIQKEFEGRGVTAGGVAPIQAGRLRENAIEALTVSSLIDAATNRFTSAQRKVARAVEEKYGPLLEEQNIKLANLELILKSPTYDRATKERAEKQKLVEETRKVQLETKKKEQEEIWKTATDAAKGGASSTILESIRTAKTKEEALQLAAPFLAREEKPTGDIAEFKAFFPKADLATPAGQQQYLNWKARTGAAGRKGEKPTAALPADTVASRLNSVGLSPAVITTGNKLTKGNADAVAAQGVPPSVVELITQAILEGNNLDKVRQALTEGYGKDVGFGYLDKYMGTLQEKKSGTKLDKLLESL